MRTLFIALALSGCYAATPPDGPACLGTDLTPLPGERVFRLSDPGAAETCVALCNFSRYFEPGCANAADLCPYPEGAEIPEHVRDACGERIRAATSADELEALIATCYCEDL